MGRLVEFSVPLVGFLQYVVKLEYVMKCTSKNVFSTSLRMYEKHF